MMSLAVKMLIGNKASFLGVVFGIFLATLLISQQSAIFLGLVSRSYRVITDIPSPDIWIVDPATESDEKLRGMPRGYLSMVRSIPGIEWAVPINVMYSPLVTSSGIFSISQLYGIDDSTLIGAPQEIVEGNIRDLNREGAVILDVYSANGILARILPDGTKEPLKIGDSLEINDKRAVIVAISKITQGFYPQPIIFTTNSNFNYFRGTLKDTVEFIAAKKTPQTKMEDVLTRINEYPMLNGLSKDQFKWRIAKSFLKTGILINFGLSVALGLIIGFSIAGQIFYIMTLQNLMYYALIKALGGNQNLISKMIFLQVLIVGAIGFLIGTGVTILWGMAIKNTTLAFLFPWQLLVFTGLIVVLICLFTAGLSIHRIGSTDPKALMGN